MQVLYKHHLKQMVLRDRLHARLWQLPGQGCHTTLPPVPTFSSSLGPRGVEAMMCLTIIILTGNP